MGDQNPERTITATLGPELDKERLRAKIAKQLADAERNSSDARVVIAFRDENDNLWNLVIKSAWIPDGRRYYTVGQELVAESTILTGVGCNVKSRYNEREQFIREVVDYLHNYDYETPGKYP